jgi:hypothetical protein
MIHHQQCDPPPKWSSTSCPSFTPATCLITSRFSHWGGGVQARGLDVLDPADAGAFLLEEVPCPARVASISKTPSQRSSTYSIMSPSRASPGSIFLRRRNAAQPRQADWRSGLCWNRRMDHQHSRSRPDARHKREPWGTHRSRSCP